MLTVFLDIMSRLRKGEGIMPPHSVLIIADNPFTEAGELGPYGYTLDAHATAIREHDDFYWLGCIAPAPEFLRRAKQEWQTPIAVTSLDELAEPPAADIVILLTEPQRRAGLIQQLGGARWVVVEQPLGLGVADSEAFMGFCRTNGVEVLVNGAWRTDPLVRTLAGGGAAAAIGDIQCAFGAYGQGLWHMGTMMADLVPHVLGPISIVHALEEVRHIENAAVPDDQSAAFCLNLHRPRASGDLIVTVDCRNAVETGLYLTILGNGGRLTLSITEAGSTLQTEPIGGPLRTQSSSANKILKAFYANLAACAAGTETPACPIADAVDAERVIEVVLDSADHDGERFHYR